jgi:ABC-type lipoprotein export system ATPase subunit
MTNKQIYNVLKYIKKHEKDTRKPKSSQERLQYSIDAQSFTGCDIYTAITTEKIQLAPDQLGVIFRKLKLIQQSTNESNLSNLPMEAKDWQGKRVCLTNTGELLLHIYQMLSHHKQKMRLLSRRVKVLEKQINRQQ